MLLCPAGHTGGIFQGFDTRFCIWWRGLCGKSLQFCASDGGELFFGFHIIYYILKEFYDKGTGLDRWIRRIKLCYCDIATSTDLTLSATQLRSYIGYKFVQEAEFHHHDGKPYRYPLIQYKRIRDRLSVLGIEHFADVVQENLSSLQKIYLKNTEILINNMIFTRKTHSITEEITEYKFATPWIALNTDNYLKYNTLDKRFHKKLLEKILTGNLLSMMRGIGCTIDYDLYVKINQFKQLQ